MTNSIHAHSVLNLLQDNAMTKEELFQRSSQEFGAQAQFHTCSLSELDLETLFQFFVAREKIIESHGKWSLNLARVCNH